MWAAVSDADFLISAGRACRPHPCLGQRLEALRASGAIDPAADLDAVATALSSLSFSLGFIDQVVFGMDPERAATIARAMAGIVAAGLAPAR